MARKPTEAGNSTPYGTNTGGLFPGVAKRESAMSYSRRTTEWLGQPYVTSTEAGYWLLYRQREPLSRKLLESVDKNLQNFAKQWAAELRIKEDEVLKAQASVIDPSMTTDQFVKALGDRTNHLNTLGFRTTYDADAEFASIWGRLKMKSFRDAFAEELINPGSFDTAAYKEAVGGMQNKTKNQILRVLNDLIGASKALQDPKQRTKIFTGDGIGERYLADQIIRTTEILYTAVKKLDLFDLPPLNLKDYEPMSDKLMYHMIGNVSELNNAAHFANISSAIVRAIKDPAHKKAMEAKIEEISDGVIIRAVGANQGRKQKDMVKITVKENGKVSKVPEKYGTVDLTLTLDENIEPILIDLKSAASSPQVKDNYTLNFGKMDVWGTLKKVIENNPELKDYYFMLLTNIYIYSRLYLNENEQQAALFTLLSGRGDDIKARFATNLANKNTYPTLVTVSTNVYRFSYFIEKMANVMVSWYNLGTNKDKASMTLPFDKSLRLTEATYNAKIKVWRGQENNAAELKRVISASSSSAMNTIFQAKEKSITLRIKLGGYR